MNLVRQIRHWCWRLLGTENNGYGRALLGTLELPEGWVCIWGSSCVASAPHDRVFSRRKPNYQMVRTRFMHQDLVELVGVGGAYLLAPAALYPDFMYVLGRVDDQTVYYRDVYSG